MAYSVGILSQTLPACLSDEHGDASLKVSHHHAHRDIPANDNRIVVVTDVITSDNCI